MANGIPNYKVVLTGDYGVGKSSIFRRYNNNSFVECRHPSGDNSSLNIGQDYCRRGYNVNGRDMQQLELWDTAGLERFSTLSSSYYSKAVATIVCYSLDNEESLSSAAQHILDAMQHTGTASIFLCGNKSDRKQDNNFRCITSEVIDNFLVQFDGVITRSYCVSCKTGQGLDEMFLDISRYLQRRADDKYNNPARVFLTQDSEVNNSASTKRGNACC